ncbi:hypothetical protein [Bacillus mycoides]|uniref:hypothetical protein n=1 Tax=Bacillus mycoides TaxID=1405 RepID=UPI001495D53D|nr:hypothetical protein [Bacillus mycoides]
MLLIEYETDLIEDMDCSITLKDSNNERGWRIFHPVNVNKMFHYNVTLLSIVQLS